METRIDFRTQLGHLISGKNWAVVLVVICLVSLASIGFAQKAVASDEESVSGSNSDEKEVTSFPYFAEITADSVNIRSGPGTNYYSCGKLNKADRVKVVGHRFSWSCIVSPQGCFSWISKQYVEVDKNDSGIGIVTGDGVRVYAGSEELKPMHSTTQHFKLNKGDKVKLLGQEKDDYYKIAPPAGAYLWVSTKYTKSLGSAVKVAPTIVEPEPEVKVKPETTPAIEPEEKAEVPAVVPTKIGVESQKLKEYYALKEQIKAERAKPIGRQNYTDIKKALLEIANNKESGKAARYCEFALKQVKRFELAQEVNKALRSQDTQLQKVQEKIEKAHTARLAQVQDLGRFVAIGRFQVSSVYGPEAERRHYLIVDDSGKIICYALPVGSAANMDLSKFTGRKVGLVGTIKPHPQTSGALVRFIDIAKIR